MSEILIRLDMIPPTATSQQKGQVVKNGIILHYKKANVKRAERDYMALLAYHTQRPQKPLQGAILVEYEFDFPYRKTEPKKNRTGRIPKVSKPDCDNMAKVLQDCMTRLNFWNDDSQIYDVRIRKFWSEVGRISIRIDYCSDLNQ